MNRPLIVPDEETRNQIAQELEAACWATEEFRAMSTSGFHTEGILTANRLIPGEHFSSSGPVWHWDDEERPRLERLLKENNIPEDSRLYLENTHPLEIVDEVELIKGKKGLEHYWTQLPRNNSTYIVGSKEETIRHFPTSKPLRPITDAPVYINSVNMDDRLYFTKITAYLFNDLECMTRFDGQYRQTSETVARFELVRAVFHNVDYERLEEMEHEVFPHHYYINGIRNTRTHSLLGRPEEQMQHIRSLADDLEAASPTAGKRLQEIFQSLAI
ncbi:MAG: hypothetical protein ABH879_10475 [archaeon]